MREPLITGSLVPARSLAAAAGAVPLSLAAHAVAIAAVLTLPLIADGAPPPLHSRNGTPIVLTVPAPPPVPPPPVRVTVAHRPVRRGDRTRPAPAPAPTRLVPVGDVPPIIPVEEPGHCSGCPLSTGAASAGGAGMGDGPPGGGGGGDGAGPGTGPAVAGRDVRPPVKLRHLDPAYPDLARRAGVQGTVVIECVIDAHGRVADARVLRGSPLLDAAAVAAVRQWRYRPTLLGGAAVPVLMTVTVHFRLK